MLFNYEGNSKLPGIYEIINPLNGKRYIGSAKEFKERWKKHYYCLKTNKHKNEYLQYSFNKHFEELGHDNFFEFHILEVMKNSTKEERLIREEFWINFALENNVELYNSNFFPTKEPKIISFPSDEAKKNLSIKSKTNPNCIKTQFKKGRTHKHSEECKQKIGKSNSKIYDLSQNPLIGPNGQIILKIENLAEFCRNHNLGSGLCAVLNGKYKSSRGWYLANTVKKASAAKTYKNFGILISPTGEKFSTIENMSQFCREHNLLKEGDPKNLVSLLSGKIKICKGWKIILN